MNRHERQVESPADVEVARYYRADAEITLLREKQEASPPKKERPTAQRTG